MRGWEDRRSACPSDEVQVLAAARWIDMLCCALVEGEVPTAAPSAPPTVAALLHTLAPRLAPGPRSSAEERRCGLWMRGAYDPLRGHTSPGLLAQWQAVMKGNREGKMEPAAVEAVEEAVEKGRVEEAAEGAAGPTAERAA